MVLVDGLGGFACDSGHTAVSSLSGSTAELCYRLSLITDYENYRWTSVTPQHLHTEALTPSASSSIWRRDFEEVRRVRQGQ